MTVSPPPLHTIWKKEMDTVVGLTNGLSYLTICIISNHNGQTNLKHGQDHGSPLNPPLPYNGVSHPAPNKEVIAPEVPQAAHMKWRKYPG